MPRRDVSGEPVKGERTAPGRHVNGYHEAPEEWTRAQTKCNISIEVTSQLKVAWVMQLFHHFDQASVSDSHGEASASVSAFLCPLLERVLQWAAARG